MRRLGRKRKQLWDDLKENRRQWDLKQKAPDRTVCRMERLCTCRKIDYAINPSTDINCGKRSVNVYLKKILPLAAQVLSDHVTALSHDGKRGSVRKIPS